MLFLANIAGWFASNWKLLLYVLGGVALLFIFGLTMRSCLRPKPVVVDVESLNKIQNGNRAEVKKELQKVVEENADVVRTNDNRSAITDVNVVERNREVDERVEAATQKVIEAKSNGQNVTQEKLECILVPENCK